MKSFAESTPNHNIGYRENLRKTSNRLHFGLKFRHATRAARVYILLRRYVDSQNNVSIVFGRSRTSIEQRLQARKLGQNTFFGNCDDDNLSFLSNYLRDTVDMRPRRPSSARPKSSVSASLLCVTDIRSPLTEYTSPRPLFKIYNTTLTPRAYSTCYTRKPPAYRYFIYRRGTVYIRDTRTAVPTFRALRRIIV